MPDGAEVSTGPEVHHDQSFVWDVIERRCLWIRGADAGSYLHSQLSNDIARLAPGDSCQSFVLEPTGKINALVRVTRMPTAENVETSVDTYVLDTDADEDDFSQLVQRLQRFKIRVKADMTEGTITTIVLRRVDTSDPSSTESETPRPTRELLQTALDDVDDLGFEHLVVNAWWADGRAFDVLVVPKAMSAAPTDAAATSVDKSESRNGTEEISVDFIGKLSALLGNLERAGDGDFENLRVRSGWPAMGSEIRPGETIPAATGIVRRVASFTKGCYPGQELVERMDSRGSSAPQSLRIVSLDDLDPLQYGSVIIMNGKEVGSVTSVAGRMALAYVSRTVELGVVVGDT